MCITRLLSMVVVSIAISSTAMAQGRGEGKRQPLDPAAVARLVADSGGDASVSIHEATGAARFARSAPGRKLGLLKQADRAVSADAKKGRAAEFFGAYGSAFGILNPGDELQAIRVETDRQKARGEAALRRALAVAPLAQGGRDGEGGPQGDREGGPRIAEGTGTSGGLGSERGQPGVARAGKRDLGQRSAADDPRVTSIAARYSCCWMALPDTG
jgi:hypothetical protein